MAADVWDALMGPPIWGLVLAASVLWQPLVSPLPHPPELDREDGLFTFLAGAGMGSWGELGLAGHRSVSPRGWLGLPRSMDVSG